MKCIIGHEIKTETGFKVFEAGRDYPPEEIGDRGKYFEAQKAPEPEPPAPKRAAKIKQEVKENDTAS